MLKVGEVKYKNIHYYEKISEDYEIGKSVIKCIHPKLTWRLFLVKIRYNWGPTAQRKNSAIFLFLSFAVRWQSWSYMTCILVLVCPRWSNVDWSSSPASSSGFLGLKSEKTRILFVFCSHVERVMSAEKGAGDLGEEKKGGPLDFLFSLSLPFLRLPHRLPLIVFFVEIWQSGRGRPPASYQLATHTHVRNMRVSQACGHENADRTHNVEKSENRTPRVVRITLYWLFGSFLLLCSAVYCAKVVSWSLEMTHTKLIHSGAPKDYFLRNILSETQTLPRIFCYLWTANIFLMTAPFTFWSLIFTFNFPSYAIFRKKKRET